jgi:hypothetical protein
VSVPSAPPWWLFVRFEQGRGKGGVPKAVISYTKPSDGEASIATLVRIAVQTMRAICADPSMGHGRDLMPGDDAEYALHNIDGGVIEEAKQIVWQQALGTQVAEVALTWGLPSERLAAERRS